MKKILIILLLFPLFCMAGQLEFRLFFDENNPQGFVVAPGRAQVPVYTVNVLLPAQARLDSCDFSFAQARPAAKSEYPLNPGWQSASGSLDAAAKTGNEAFCQYLGIKKWGDLSYASFKVLPYQADGALWHEAARLKLEYSAPKNARNYLPQTFALESFFVNQSRLNSWYQVPSHRNYDILIVSNPALYAAMGAWQSFRQNQGLAVAFADINDILANTAGVNSADKLRNYLIQEYETAPFMYLLILGDYDTVPVAYLNPEPGSSNTSIPSDFFYSDLSSAWDANGNGLYGEYSAGAGQGDSEIDFTPEIFVGRISTNNVNEVTAIAERCVDFETNGDDYRHKALLPAAYANYANEPVYGMGATDGGDFMELCRATVLSGYEATTLYEQEGVLPSHSSTYELSYENVSILIRGEDFGIINWNAHGSATSSSRKIWMNDINNNGQADPWEMQWRNMVDVNSFDGITAEGGTVVFAASCYNGQIDANYPSLAEYALIKKGVGAIGATRTGWYKPGWQNPGWGGLSSYNYHWLENYAEKGLSLGAAHAYTNLMHSQYYLFGDPLDDDGVIWPELQNIYTYLLYGDPVIGHSPMQLPDGEILVFQPSGEPDFRLRDSFVQLTDKNIVFSNRLIPDYDYITGFDAVFAILGSHSLSDWETDILNYCLDAGGKLYIEADPALLPQSIATKLSFQSEAAPAGDYAALLYAGRSWEYQGVGYAALNAGADAQAIFALQNAAGESFGAGLIHNSAVGYRSLLSTFRLEDVADEPNTFSELVQVILEELGILEMTDNLDAVAAPALKAILLAWPNPARNAVSIRLENSAKALQEVVIYNIRGQRVKSLLLDSKKGFIENWNLLAEDGKRCPAGIYILEADEAVKRISILP